MKTQVQDVYLVSVSWVLQRMCVYVFNWVESWAAVARMSLCWYQWSCCATMKRVNPLTPTVAIQLQSIPRPGYAVICNFRHPGTLTLSPEFQSARMSKNFKWRLNTVWHRMLYSCADMATVGVKGLRWLWEGRADRRLYKWNISEFLHVDGVCRPGSSFTINSPDLCSRVTLITLNTAGMFLVMWRSR